MYGYHCNNNINKLIKIRRLNCAKICTNLLCKKITGELRNEVSSRFRGAEMLARLRVPKIG